MEKLKVGDFVVGSIIEGHVVALEYDPNDINIDHGEVVEALPDGKIKVKWNADYNNNPIYKKGSRSIWRNNSDIERYEPALLSVEEVSYLVSPEEVDGKLSELEKEYKKLEEIIISKLQLAAALINDASGLAGDIDLSSMYNATRPLLNALDEAGWHTSSLNC